MKPLIDDINRIIYRIYKTKNPALASIILNWQKIAGVRYSNSWPFKLSNIKEKGQQINILWVQVDDNAISMEMEARQEIMIERVAIFMGYKAVNKIRTIVR